MSTCVIFRQLKGMTDEEWQRRRFGRMKRLSHDRIFYSSDSFLNVLLICKKNKTGVKELICTQTNISDYSNQFCKSFIISLYLIYEDNLVSG